MVDSPLQYQMPLTSETSNQVLDLYYGEHPAISK